MPNSISTFSKLTTVVSITLFGSFLGLAAEPASQNTPMIKNLMALTYRAPAVQAAVPRELTKRDVKKLAATAKSAEDHLKIAGYYNAQADRLEANAAGYEEAAARYQHSPLVKNLMSPTTPGRYAFIAKGYREEASSNRAQAVSHEQMAKNTAAGF